MSFNRLFGESFITYNPDWQELNITKAETKSSTGEITKSPFNAYNKVLPGEVGQAVPYMNLREMVVTHTGLERNCEVNFGYSLTSKKGFYPGLIGKIIIGAHEPIKALEIVIKVPKETKINLYMSNNGPIGEKSTKDNFDYYTWKLYDLPLIPVESNQPNMEIFLPTLYISTVTNAEIVKHIGVDNESKFELSQKAKEFCKELTKNQFTFQDKCFALRNYIYQNVGQTNIDLNYIGWKSIAVQETFDRNVGSKLDRAILLTAFCRALGIKTDLVMTSNFSNAKPDVTLLSQIGEYLVYCTPDNDKDMPLLLDPNNPQTSILPRTVLRKPSFVMNSMKISLIPGSDEKNTLTFSANIKILKEQAEGNGKIRLSGDYIPDIDNDINNKSINNFFKKTGWTSDDKGKLNQTSNEISKEVSIKKIYDKKLDEIIEIDLPFISEKLKRLELIPTSRVTPFAINSLIDEEYNFTIELPKEMKSLFKPEELNVANPIGEVQSRFKTEGNQIQIERKIKINKLYITPDEYHYLYELFSAWRKKNHCKVLVK